MQEIAQVIEFTALLRPRQAMLFGEILERAPFWQTRFYDFTVWTEKKRVEKLRYMHRNPVKRGLAATPEEWRWSSYRFYLRDESGPVGVNEGWGRISFRAGAAWKVKLMVPSAMAPTLRKNREGWGSHGVASASENKSLGPPPEKWRTPVLTF